MGRTTDMTEGEERHRQHQAHFDKMMKESEECRECDENCESDYHYPDGKPVSREEEWPEALAYKLQNLLDIAEQPTRIEEWNGYANEVFHLFRTQIALARKEGDKRLEKVIGEHNARILNEFQMQMKPDVPMIVYDERIALIPAITIATKETLSLLTLT